MPRLGQPPAVTARLPGAVWPPEIDVPCLSPIKPPAALPSLRRPWAPNILMFGDSAWVARRTDEQTDRLDISRQTVRRPVEVDLGDGKAIPSVCKFCAQLRAPLTSINEGVRI